MKLLRATSHRQSIAKTCPALFLVNVCLLFGGCERAESKLARARFGVCPANVERAVLLTELSWLPLLGQSTFGFPAALQLEPFLAAAGFRATDLKEVLAIAVEQRAGFIFKVSDSAAAIAQLKNTGLHSAVLNRHGIVMVPMGPGGVDDGLWFWTALDKTTLAFGQRRVVSQLIEVSEGQRPSLYDGRSELRHLLRSAVDAEIAVYGFVAAEDSPSAVAPISSNFPAAEKVQPMSARQLRSQASVWGLRRSEQSALLFVFFETRSRTVARVMANLGDYLSLFQTVSHLDGYASPRRLACDQEGSLVRIYGFVSRTLADRTLTGLQKIDAYGRALYLTP